MVLRKAESDFNRNPRYLCRCDCGTEFIVLGSNLLAGRTKSCGCLKKERMIAYNRFSEKFSKVFRMEEPEYRKACKSCYNGFCCRYGMPCSPLVRCARMKYYYKLKMNYGYK